MADFALNAVPMPHGPTCACPVSIMLSPLKESTTIHVPSSTINSGTHQLVFYPWICCELPTRYRSRWEGASSAAHCEPWHARSRLSQSRTSAPNIPAVDTTRPPTPSANCSAASDSSSSMHRSGPPSSSTRHSSKRADWLSSSAAGLEQLPSRTASAQAIATRSCSGPNLAADMRTRVTARSSCAPFSAPDAIRVSRSESAVSSS
mmetsp:Transcript_25428/g.64630  ORF Transcript_25428/g.64630 Transcript_25428/m.64630 type:complete len:205 (-) Transcript_25428:361-975(-)